MDINEKLRYDKDSDSLFIVVRAGEEDRFEEVMPGVNIELDSDGEIIGVEILGASRFSDKLKGALNIEG